MKTKKKLFIIITIFLFVSMSLVITLNVVRSQMYTTTTSTQYLCPYSSYFRSVVKSSAPHIMMPARLEAEWTSFTSNFPSGVGLTVTSIGCCLTSDCTDPLCQTCSSNSCLSDFFMCPSDGGECCSCSAGSCVYNNNWCPSGWSCDGSCHCCEDGQPCVAV